MSLLLEVEPACPCGSPVPSGEAARCPLPLDPLGPEPAATVAALSDLGLGPADIARYHGVAESRVRHLVTQQECMALRPLSGRGLRLG